MSVHIHTTSGSVYIVRGDTVTRAAPHGVVNYNRAIVADTMTAWGVPLVGFAWRFTTDAGPFTTTPVRRVEVVA